MNIKVMICIFVIIFISCSKDIKPLTPYKQKENSSVTIVGNSSYTFKGYGVGLIFTLMDAEGIYKASVKFIKPDGTIVNYILKEAGKSTTIVTKYLTITYNTIGKWKIITEVMDNMGNITIETGIKIIYMNKSQIMKELNKILKAMVEMGKITSYATNCVNYLGISQYYNAALIDNVDKVGIDVRFSQENTRDLVKVQVTTNNLLKHIYINAENQTEISNILNTLDAG